jgi:hypothetical protein
MKKVFLFGSTGIVLFLAGCSGNSQKTVLASAPAVAQAPAQVDGPAKPASAPAPNSSAIVEAVAPPMPSAGSATPQAWHLQNVKDDIGGAVMLKQASSDGKYDLVILERGRQPFVSFVKHDRWESAHNLPGQGSFMILRAKFENGEEKRIEWDALGFATENLNSVLWSYPAKKDAPLGPMASSADVTVGGDDVLVQDMLKHKTMLLEVAPGVATQFDLTSLAREMEKARAPKTDQVIEARQPEE